jgi:hypothetical protein
MVLVAIAVNPFVVDDAVAELSADARRILSPGSPHKASSLQKQGFLQLARAAPGGFATFHPAALA